MERGAEADERRLYISGKGIFTHKEMVEEMVKFDVDKVTGKQNF